jgi:hypothetical protein
MPQQNLFVTLDASDYAHIASVDVEKTIYDLALDVPDPGTHACAHTLHGTTRTYP